MRCRHRDHLGEQRDLPPRRLGGWTGPSTTDWNGTSDVDTISTDERTGPG